MMNHFCVHFDICANIIIRSLFDFRYTVRYTVPILNVFMTRSDSGDNYVHRQLYDRRRGFIYYSVFPIKFISFRCDFLSNCNWILHEWGVFDSFIRDDDGKLIHMEWNYPLAEHFYWTRQWARKIVILLTMWLKFIGMIELCWPVILTYRPRVVAPTNSLLLSLVASFHVSAHTHNEMTS